MAGLAREATWNFLRRGKSGDLSQDVYNSAMEVCSKGWMRGPFSLEDLPEGSVLTPTVINDGRRLEDIQISAY